MARVPDDAPTERGVVRKNDHDDRKRKALQRAGFSWRLANKVLDRLADGISLTRIAKDRDMPNYKTIHLWVQNNDEFADLFRKARDIYYQMMADETIDIVDNLDAKGKSRSGTKEKIWRDRLRAEQRQWTLARALPKLYGTRPIDPDTAAKLSSDLLGVIKLVTEIASGRRTQEGAVIEGEFTEVTDTIRDTPWKPAKKKDAELIDEGQKLGASLTENEKSS